VINLLNNPVYNALLSGDKHLGFGKGKVRSFDEAVSPFAGFEEGYENGFEDLRELLPQGRYILYATPSKISTYAGWRLVEHAEGVQMLYTADFAFKPIAAKLEKLTREHVPEMVVLAQLTKPGPFGPRTIEFGEYFGVFEDNRLAAMAGQRMHVQHYTEISAVCTHPDYAGKGYASALVQHQVNLICAQGRTPFLHVRADNTRAIEVYQRLGFLIRGPMNFYFLRRKDTPA